MTAVAVVFGGFSFCDFDEWEVEEGHSPRINPVCLCLADDDCLGLERVWLWFGDCGSDDGVAMGERYRELTSRSRDFCRRV